MRRVLWNDPGTGVMRHADAGYQIAIDCAREQGLDLPMIEHDRSAIIVSDASSRCAPAS